MRHRDAFGQMWKVRGKIFTVNIAMILLFVAAGLGIDILLDTSPKGLLASVIISFPITQIVMIKALKKNMDEITDNLQDSKLRSQE